jgi:hypothetical protein
MTTSESINEIASALAKAQSEMGGAVKDSANPFFKSKYADLSSVWDACRGPLTKNGLSIVQFPKTEYTGTPEPYEWTSKMGEKRYGVRVVCVVSVLTRITHASGQWMEDSVSTMLPTGDPQSVGSAITYLRRYALQSVAGIAPEDDDGEKAHGNGTTQTAKTVAAPVAVAPNGYEDWLIDLGSVVDEGTDRLQKAWKESKAEYRQHLTATNPKLWEAMKATAARVLVPA